MRGVLFTFSAAATDACHPVELNLESERKEDENVDSDGSGPKDYISEVRESSLWAPIRDYFTLPDVLATRSAGPKWNCAKLYGEFAASWFFLMTKDGSEEGAQPEWLSLCLDYRQNFGFDHGMFDPGWLLDMPCALRNARDDAGEWRERYKGHLLHELACAGGIKLLETGGQKAPRATHGSQRLVMPGKPSMWATSTRPCQ